MFGGEIIKRYKHASTFNIHHAFRIDYLRRELGTSARRALLNANVLSVIYYIGNSCGGNLYAYRLQLCSAHVTLCRQCVHVNKTKCIHHAPYTVLTAKDFSYPSGNLVKEIKTQANRSLNQHTSRNKCIRKETKLLLLLLLFNQF